jgi:hypothetical protein
MRSRLKTVSCVALIGLLAGACAGCFPYYGLGQKRVPRAPLVLVDAQTGGATDGVLMIPRYSSFSGISTGAGHGPEFSTGSEVFIAHPFLYRQGKNFSPRQTSSAGVITLWPLAFVGSGSTLDGIMVVAPGYKPKWLSDLWPEEQREIFLNPIVGSAARAELQRISAMIEDKTLSEADKRMFAYASPDPIYVRLTEREKQLIRSFVSEALTNLPGAEGSI